MINEGKRNVLGVMVDAIDYDAATETVVAAATQHRPLAVTALAVHGVMLGARDEAHAARLNAFDVVAPDGQPVRWALNLLYHAGLPDRVYGPALTMRVLSRCASAGLPVYLYGSTDSTLRHLVQSLQERLPDLRVAGTETSKFRPAHAGEAAEIAGRIRASRARLLLVGLGCPRQEVFATALRPLLDMPVMAVGAAFDYLSGRLPQPPAWMQRAGLEWLWRLIWEPRRLWRRYLLLNPAYLARLSAQKTHVWRAVAPPARAEAPRSFAV